MTKRLTDEELDELERECLSSGPVTERLFVHRAMMMSETLPSLLAEVRELRRNPTATEEADSEHLGEFCFAAADGVLMLLAEAENSRKALAEAQAEAEVLKREHRLWLDIAGEALQKYATQTGCARPGEHLGKAALAAVLEANELRALKAQLDRIGSCGFCCGYGALPSVGDDMPMNRCCDECGGLP